MFRDNKGKIRQVNLHPTEQQLDKGMSVQDVEIDYVQVQREAQEYLVKNGVSVKSAVLALVKY